MIYEYDDVVTAKDVLTGRVKKEDIIGKRGWLLDFIPIDMNMDEIDGALVGGASLDPEKFMDIINF